MKIVQLTTVGTTIYGLGDDGQIYRWHPEDRKWIE